MISIRLPLAIVATGALAFLTLGLHAERRMSAREREQAAVMAVTRLMPAADLSLAGAARHLRFPSLEEPGAAFTDAPASPDVDPAGAALAPPINVYVDSEPAPRREAAPKPLGQAAPK